jgi:hypothetical protein
MKAHAPPGATTPAKSVQTLAAVGICLIVFAGFARSYYLKWAVGGQSLTGLLHLHGIVMTLWLTLFVLQVRLVAARRVALHRRLGWAGMVLAVLVLVCGTAVALAGARRDLAEPEALAFLTQPLGDLLVFAILIGLGCAYRRRRDVHSRLMLLANLAILTPAIARIPLGFIAHGGTWVIFGLNDLCVLAFLLYDTAKQRRLHPALAWGALWIVVAQPLRLLIGAQPAWMQLARALVT